MPTPWVRVRHPPALPDPPQVTTLQQMSDGDFAALLRAHLVPRDADRHARTVWDAYWHVLSGDADLNDRAFEVLEQFRAACEAAVPENDQEARRISRFLRQVEEAQNRLDRDESTLGPTVEARLRRYPRIARRPITELVTAIDTHRSNTDATSEPTHADRDLWAVLSALGLDPRGKT